MGCLGSKDRLTKEDMEFLKTHTRYDEATIKEWYKGFKVRFITFYFYSKVRYYSPMVIMPMLDTKLIILKGCIKYVENTILYSFFHFFLCLNHLKIEYFNNLKIDDYNFLLKKNIKKML